MVDDALPTFEDLSLDPRLCGAVAKLGFEKPTPIQAQAIPVLLEGRDVIGGARTGSGKTAAFGLPLLDKVKEAGGTRALVLVPTRELAQQVTGELKRFAGQMQDVKIFAIYGGAPYGPQLDAFRRGVTVVVGTPGRLLDHLERGVMDLSGVDTVVLDEADEMLRMGFIDDVETLLEATPEGRQIALFSATVPDRIEQMASNYLVDPVEVRVEQEALSVDHIKQSWMLVPFRHKVDALVRVLRAEQREATLVFVRTRKAAAEVADELAHRGLAVDALHGDMAQSARDRVLVRLRAGQLGVLIATDVAARGIDVAHVSHVINFDMPDDLESYVHRIGRTGRAGRNGRAISFVTPREQRRVRHFQRTLKVDIPREEVASDAQIAVRGRKALWADVVARMEEGGLDDIEEWVDFAMRHTDWKEDPPSLRKVAATVISMLADERGAVFEDRSDALPAWAQPPRKAGPADRNQDWVDLFLPVGRRKGARPGDIMGALTHGAGLSGNQVGRITILDYKTFVGVPREIVEQLLENVDTVQVRGIDVPLRKARVRTGPPKGKRPQGGKRFKR